MRKFTVLILSALLCWAPIVFIAGCSGGCATGKGQYNPTTGLYDTNAIADTVVVTAENLREAALGVFDALMRTEKEHEAALKTLNPKIHDFTEEIRKNGKGWLDDLTKAKTAYQAARTADNASRLNSTLAVVRVALVTASKHLAEASARKAP